MLSGASSVDSSFILRLGPRFGVWLSRRFLVGLIDLVDERRRESARQPAVNDNLLSGDEPRSFEGQEECRVGDLVIRPPQ